MIPYDILNPDHHFFIYFPKPYPWSQGDKVCEDMGNHARPIFPPLENNRKKMLPLQVTLKMNQLALYLDEGHCVGIDETLLGCAKVKQEQSLGNW